MEGVISRLKRDAELPLSRKLVKAARYAAARLTAPFRLRACDLVGPGARTRHAPLVANFGRIEIGARVHLLSMWAPVELRASPGATLSLGDDVTMNFGCKVQALTSVRIGSKVSFGPYVSVADDVVIEDGVWIATRAEVRRGARIGKGAVITAGSVVEGEIPAGVIAGGNPARPLGQREPALPKPVLVKPAQQGPVLKGLVAGDFNLDELARRLGTAHTLGPSLSVEAAPFGQLAQPLLEINAGTRETPDFLFVWNRPEAIPAFRERAAGHDVPLEAFDQDVDALVKLLAGAKVPHLFVAGFATPPWQRGLGMIDTQQKGLAAALWRMNLRLAEQLEKLPNAHLLDAQRWVAHAGRGGLSEKLWYMGKIAFGPAVFDEAAEDLRAALRGLKGQARKLLVLDLDDTMWGGIVGDAGWENLRLGGHDAVGESFVEFQRAVKALTKRGIVLGIVSKNEESVALEAIDKHPEMVLRRDDFAAFRINWRDKAQNLAELVAELNLGLQSVVFIDDNPVERARVREALPEVYVPEWPEEKTRYVSALQSLRCFDTPAISREDAERTALYAQEKKREALKAQVGSLDEWLLSLDIRVQFARLAPSNLARAAQLLNKTNQMNLTTRRLGEAELKAWDAEPGHELWTVSVSDKLGDAGLTGLLGLSHEGGTTRVVDYVLSCRVMGRAVEETLVWAAVERAREAGSQRVEARYLETKKNKPCLGFWQRSGFACEENVFRFELSGAYPLPKPITALGLAGDEKERKLA